MHRKHRKISTPIAVIAILGLVLGATFASAAVKNRSQRLAQNMPYDQIVKHAPLIVDTRNATRNVKGKQEGEKARPLTAP